MSFATIAIRAEVGNGRQAGVVSKFVVQARRLRHGVGNARHTGHGKSKWPRHSLCSP